jgi:hypothetical protein
MEIIMRKLKRTIGLVLLVLLLINTFSPAQIEFPKFKKPKLDFLSRFIKGEPVLTTSFEDAIYSLEFLDGFNPAEFQDMRSMERDARGAFLLPPGNYQLEADSFCLNAGTYGPGEGKGYLLADLKGKKAAEISTILREYALHPEISQSDVQTLLWGILSKTKIRDMDPELQQVASQLLSSDQISNLNGGLLGYLPKQLKGAAYDKLPEFAKKIIEAEAKINELLSAGYASYEELEEIAVLVGIPTDDGPQIPVERWSLSSNGYFIRFLPEHYTKTIVQVVVPEEHFITRDAIGRIIVIEDSSGYRIETEYDDSAETIIVAGDPGIKGYYFKKIRSVNPHAGQAAEAEIEEYEIDGWTFVGIPNGKGYFPDAETEAGENASGPHFAVSYKGTEAGDVGDRYQKVDGFWQDMKNTRRRADMSDVNSDQTIRDITDMKHYNDGLDAAKGADLKAKSDWMAEHTSRMLKAWVHSTNKLGGIADQMEKRSVFDMSRYGALPGSRSRQRLGMSGR